MGILKKAATLANEELGLLSKDKSVRITKAADEVIEGNLDKHFPLSVWQTGSGMHSNMNVNEVIAARAIELAGGKATSKTQIDPTTDINMSHSHNDAFSTAMNISAAMEMKSVLIPAVKKLQNSFINKAKEFESILKIGRTHTMDAFLMTFEQQFNGYAKLLSNDVERLEKVLTAFYQLPLGGMIVGTDIIETNQKFAPKIVKQIAKITKFPFVLTTNKLTAISSQDIMANAHSTIKVLATSLLKISNDIRLLASGPRCGFGELILPENDMIDPLFVGKNNPLHCEAVSMVCMQVFGNDTTITFAAASGQFELNAYKPVIIYNFLQSIKLLSDAMNSFEKYCVRGIKVNRKTVQNNLDNTLVIITKVVNNVGYDNAVKIMKLAHRDDLTLKEAIVKLNIMSGDEYDRIVKPEKLLAGKKN
jgi:fumarate hydratase class II